MASGLKLYDEAGLDFYDSAFKIQRVIEKRSGVTGDVGGLASEILLANFDFFDIPANYNYSRSCIFCRTGVNGYFMAPIAGPVGYYLGEFKYAPWVSENMTWETAFASDIIVGSNPSNYGLAVYGVNSDVFLTTSDFPFLIDFIHEFTTPASYSVTMYSLGTVNVPPVPSGYKRYFAIDQEYIPYYYTDRGTTTVQYAKIMVKMISDTVIQLYIHTHYHYIQSSVYPGTVKSHKIIGGYCLA